MWVFGADSCCRATENGPPPPVAYSPLPRPSGPATQTHWVRVQRNRTPEYAGCIVLITIREAGRAPPGSANRRFGFLTQGRKCGSRAPHQPVPLTCFGGVLAPPFPRAPSPEGRELGTAGQGGEEQPETAGQRPGSEPHFPFLPRASPGRPGNRAMTVT